MQEWFNNLAQQLKQSFVDEGRWHYLADGFLTTLKITLFALLIGVVIGFFVAIVRSSYDKREKIKSTTLGGKIGNGCLWVLNAVSKTYLTVFRGTPVLTQLLIIFYIVMKSTDKVTVAIIAFGLNSGAYVAEIMRSGIMSIDNGQFEAGRSLGFNYSQTMTNIILPQAFKSVLPALGNEMIVLLKETSIAGFIGIYDLTKGGDIIRSQTFQPYVPLLSVAAIYLIVVIIMQTLVNALERRLRASDH